MGKGSGGEDKRTMTSAIPYIEHDELATRFSRLDADNAELTSTIDELAARNKRLAARKRTLAARKWVLAAGMRPLTR